MKIKMKMKIGKNGAPVDRLAAVALTFRRHGLPDVRI